VPAGSSATTIRRHFPVRQVLAISLPQPKASLPHQFLSFEETNANEACSQLRFFCRISLFDSSRRRLRDVELYGAGVVKWLTLISRSFEAVETSPEGPWQCLNSHKITEKGLSCFTQPSFRVPTSQAREGHNDATAAVYMYTVSSHLVGSTLPSTLCS
jgi:hypothetical protein